ncbi:MAG: response regulator [Lysobacter sp.]|nr:response regulator [Lysobacter sp.]
MSALPVLRILLIEDSAEDAELTGIELAGAGLRVESIRVDNETALQTVLADFRPQLVLSDIALPGFSAERALQIIRAQTPDARFVIFSGTDQSDHPGVPGIDGWLCKRDAAQLPALIRRWFNLQ